MVKSTDNRSLLKVPPFLNKCYEMVDDETTNSIISWNDFNNSFVIWDVAEFSIRLLPKYFKHSNFSSFMRQLNIYGFRKTDSDHWEFANDGFIRGQKHLLMNINRRKHSQGPDTGTPSQQDNSVDLCEKVESLALQKEVENLKTGKNVLIQEFVKLREHQETVENKLLVLRERLQGMEKNQQQMLSFLVTAMQNPGILVQLIQPKENNWCMAESDNNMLEQGTQDGDPVFSDLMMVKYQPPVDGTPVPGLLPTSEKLLESDPSCNEEIFINDDFIKLLMDENTRPLESPTPFTLPDTDDGMWEQLLSSPFLEDGAHTDEDNQQPFDSSGMEIESEVCETQLEKSQNFEGLVKEMEISQNFLMGYC